MILTLKTPFEGGSHYHVRLAKGNISSIFFGGQSLAKRQPSLNILMVHASDNCSGYSWTTNPQSLQPSGKGEGRKHSKFERPKVVTCCHANSPPLAIAGLSISAYFSCQSLKMPLKHLENCRIAMRQWHVWPEVSTLKVCDAHMW